MAGVKDDELQTPDDEVGKRIWPQNQNRQNPENPQFYLRNVKCQNTCSQGHIS